MKRLLVALAAAALASPVAEAATPPAAASDAVPGGCIRPGDIANHAMGSDRQSVYILVSGKGTYRLGVKGACLQGATRGGAMVFRAIGGSSRSCKVSELLVLVNKGSGLRPCAVESISRLTPDEAKALPKDERP